MAVKQLFVNINAPSVSVGLVRGLTDNTSVPLSELVLGDTQAYQLFFVDGQGNYASWSGSASYTPYLAFGGCGQPTGGTFTLTSPNGAQTTSALAWNASLAAVQTALQALSSIGAGNVTVTGVPGVYYVLQFAGSLANQPVSPVTGSSVLLTPASNLDISTTIPGTVTPAVSCQQVVFLSLNPLVLVSNWTPITNGWSGLLSANTVSLIAAFISNNQALTDLFQITVQDPSSNMQTYVQITATALCTIVNLHAFAAAVNPTFVTAAQLAAAVLGQNNFTRQDLTATTPGNTNITPQTTSRNHTAVVNLNGATVGTYSISLQTTNSPQYGDEIWLKIVNAPAGCVINVYDTSTSGTLLTTWTVGLVTRPFWNHYGRNAIPLWEGEVSTFRLLDISDNLAGLNSTIVSKQNLKTLFNTIQNKTANYTVVASDEGSVLACSAATGSFALTLPTATLGFIVVIQKTDASAGVITTSPATVNVNAQNQLVILEGNGTGWNVILNSSGTSGISSGQNPTLSLTGVTQLVGGTTGCLDAIATAGGIVPVNTVGEIVYSASNGGPQLVLRYRLRAGTDAAAAMFIVRPADFNATSNQVVWELLSVSKQSWPCAYNATQSKFQQLSITGAAGSEQIAIGTGFTFA